MLRSLVKMGIPSSPHHKETDSRFRGNGRYSLARATHFAFGSRLLTSRLRSTARIGLPLSSVQPIMD